MKTPLAPAIALAAHAGLLACAAADRPPGSADGDACQIVELGRSLPPAVHETSGLALSRRTPGTLWTINDSGNEPVLYALDSAGALLAQVRVTGAKLIDWEDLAAGPCDAGTCLFIADIGDNAEQRDSVTIYMVPEPAPADSATAPAVAVNARYPDGARDAEAIFVLPTGDLYVVSKGRRDVIALYRFPRAAQIPGATATLERVRVLGPGPSNGSDLVTGATSSLDGRWVMIRTYRALYRYASAELIGVGTAPPMVFDLRPLRERQGEAVALSDSGAVFLSSEGENGRNPPGMARLFCRP